MARSRKVLSLLIIVTLLACLSCQEHETTPLLSLAGASGTTDSGTGNGDKENPTTASAASAANEISTLVQRVPDAENAFFTTTGRLFVSGNTGFFEVTGRHTMTAVLKDNYGMFAGIAQAGKWLYVIRFTLKTTIPSIDLSALFKSGDILTMLKSLMGSFMTMELVRADLTAGALAFTAVHVFKDMLMPNGMAADADGNLYVADETFLPSGKIVKLTISGGDDPVVTQETWLSAKDGAVSPNGIVIRGNYLYFTDFVVTSSKPGQVKKVGIINGRPGAITVLHSAFTLYDDMDAGTCQNDPVVAVADYFGNSILLINENDGTASSLGSGKFACPSSVHFGVAPQFRANELVITEKGLLMENYSSYGNKLSCMALPE